MDARSYESIYPIPDNVTIALIEEIEEMGAYTILKEYGNASAMLMMTELSRRRIRSIKKLIKVGKTEIVVVIRVDFQKGYIDISKRRIAQGENFFMEKKWKYSRNINSILTQVSKNELLTNEDCRIRWLWPLYRKFGHAIRGFNKIKKSQWFTLKNIEIPLFEFENISKIVKKKIPITLRKISSNFELTCFTKKGICVLKDIIEKGIKGKNIRFINLTSVAAPLYNISITGKSKKKIMICILKFYKIISKLVVTRKGYLIIKEIFFS